ncbi:MAG: ACT domain-containing protein [Peptococcaceae bacterium]|jgi:ACT domain-containing protein|nr:ACT domain-containing protein [Peptococcaceae bacterium]
MKAVITVLGKDTTGIIYRISEILFKTNNNILDLSQTIMEDMFTMIMLVDISKSSNSIDELNQQFKALGEELNLSIRIQHEDIFSSMHRI